MGNKRNLYVDPSTDPITEEIKKVSLVDFLKKPETSDNNDEKAKRGTSAYGQLKSPMIKVSDVVSGSLVNPIHRVFAKYSNQKWIACIDPKVNINSINEEVVDQITAGSMVTDEVAFFEGTIDSGETIYNLFVNPETSPATKSHDYWFGIEENTNQLVFVSLQGNCLKVCR